MKDEDIKQGHFYRFRDSNTVYAILFERAATGDREREVEYVVVHMGNRINPEAIRKPVSEISKWISHEVVPTWTPLTSANCEERGHHRFNSSLEDETCLDCGMGLLAARRGAQERAEREAKEKEERRQEKEQKAQAAAFLASLTGGAQ